MLKNYFKVALRYLLRYKEYTAINVFGLAVGVASCTLIMLFVRSEFNYDRFHKKADRIYRAWQHNKYEGHDFISVNTSLPMAAAIQSSFPEVESTCRVYNFNALSQTATNSFDETINMVDHDFFKLFDFKLIQGDKNNPFPSVNSIILTPATAKKFFGNSDAVGKNIELQLGDNNVSFTVAAIVQKAPEESSIKYDMLISYDNAKYLFSERMFHSWGNIFTETYVLFRDQGKVADVEKKIPAMIKQQLGDDYKENAFAIHLQSIKDIHLGTTMPTGNFSASDPKSSYILSTIGALILLLACINFITLSVGRSPKRAKEVGVRKVLGAARNQIIRQFWGETFLVTLISILIGLSLAGAFIEPFNRLIQKNLNFHFDWIFISFCMLMIASIALIAGIYPAFILSGFNPVNAFKGKFKIRNKTGLFRNCLIVGQFVVAIAMIVCTIVINKQMQYLKHKDLGYSREQVVIIPTNKKMGPGLSMAKLYKAELLKHPEVATAAVSLFSFAETQWESLGYTDNENVYRSFEFNIIDPSFIDAMKIKLVAGRNFDNSNMADKYKSIIVNETFVKEYGWKDAIGKKLPGRYDQQVVGVVKDFNYESLHKKVKPLMLALSDDSIMPYTENISYAKALEPRISVCMKPGNLSSNIDLLKRAWAKIMPNQQFAYHFLDDTIAAQYQQEERIDTITKLGSALSIFIACMGLFGLTTLTVTRRTKEIGIRKILGASSSSLVSLLSKDFLRMVVIAAFIAFPLAWWAMKTWLADFAYQTSISWWIFAITGCTALGIALITVSFQVIKAAFMNPVKNLRTE